MLYGAMGYASYRATVSGLSSPSPSVRDLTRTSQGLYTLQLGANLVWMPLFFVFRKPAIALADIVLLSGMVLGLTNTYRQLDGMAAWLLAPYSAWLGYATYLNFMTGHLNEWDISDEKVASSGKGAMS
jgi:benzodiazapine receptor